MKKPIVNVIKIVSLIIGLNGVAISSLARGDSDSHVHHEMQHGFVLSADDQFASHLVANGHHSRQTDITGELYIEDQNELEIFRNRKQQSAGGSYFLFQAQNLDLPTLSAG